MSPGSVMLMPQATEPLLTAQFPRYGQTRHSRRAVSLVTVTCASPSGGPRHSIGFWSLRGFFDQYCERGDFRLCGVRRRSGGGFKFLVNQSRHYCVTLVLGSSNASIISASPQVPSTSSVGQ